MRWYEPYKVSIRIFQELKTLDLLDFPDYPVLVLLEDEKGFR